MRTFLQIITILLISSSILQAKEYNYEVNFNNLHNDQVLVELDCSSMPFQADSSVFRFPKIIPGTYTIDDFGRFISKFKAFDSEGEILDFYKKDFNTWVIKGKSIERIQYWVEDTWDAKGKGKRVFEPSGSNFEKGKNFLWNNNALFGYFEQFQAIPFNIAITHPTQMEMSTSSLVKAPNDSTSIVALPNYRSLVDVPMMLSKVDKETIQVAGIEITLSLYCESKMIDAAYLMNQISPILEAQSNYLGGQLPVDNYHFIVYVSDVGFRSGAYGALEHKNGSVYCLLQSSPQTIATEFKSIAAHEFFHILTPLSIQSDKIANFDFSQPNMSKHLWFYEGVVEYMAEHVKLAEGLISMEEYFKNMRLKIRGAKRYDKTLSFTVMSENCLDKYKYDYGNVYQKGALIGLCLDLEIIKWTKGKKNLRDVIKELTQCYGNGNYFKEEAFFDIITEMTHPQIALFFVKYVEGNLPLPLTENLEAIGVEYADKKVVNDLSLGGLERSMDLNYSTMQFYIHDDKYLDEFGKNLGFKTGDVLIEWEGQHLSVNKADGYMSQSRQDARIGKPLSVTILRTLENGQRIKKVLTANFMEVPKERKMYFGIYTNFTDNQILFKEKWLER